MLEIKQNSSLDKVYYNGIFIGYLYWHSGLDHWCFESYFTGQIDFHDTSRDEVIDYLLVRDSFLPA